MKTFYILVISVLCVCLLSSCAQTSTNEPTWQEQYDLGIRYLSEGNYEEAIIAFTAAIEIDPRQPLAYVGRGDAYLGSGETEKNLTAAQVDYEKAMELDETLESAYLGLANVYVQQGEADKALEILRQGLERTENSQLIADKLAELEKISESDIEPEETVSYNAYGGTEFTQRYGYRDADSLTDEELTLLKTAMDFTVANDMYGLCQLGKQYTESLDNSKNGTLRILTTLNEYKVNFTIQLNSRLNIEFRPENGVGYCAYAIEGGDCRRASCACVDWQWNVVAEIIGTHDTGSYSRNIWTGPLQNSLRNGTFQEKYTDGHTTTVWESTYKDGILTSSEGDSQESNDILWSVLYGFEAQSASDDLYW